MRINVVHSCGHAVVIRRYSAFMNRAETKAGLEAKPCEKCMLARLTRAIKRRKNVPSKKFHYNSAQV